ncbi:MAG: AsmA family protein, partial [Xanthobacteraceae bacterium]|nr:AsmA family protein [Xanthobacteraceae bacterium]
MQTALLGVAIAIILALVTALVGPLFVDWGRFRDAFEAKAARVTGLEVKIDGPIEVRLLPTPTVKLQAIEAGRAGEVVRARSMQIEFALDALMRGELRAANVAVVGPEVSLGLDRSGRFEWSAAGSDAESFAMDRISVEDGRLTLADARSGGSLSLETLSFRGELRSLAGPAKGDGAFRIADEPYSYHLSTNRAAADGAVRVRLVVETAEQPRLADIDGSIWNDHGIPHFDANLQWARGSGRASAGEPFRVTGHARGTSAAVALDKVELQYGPEERAARLHGDANLTLGEKPELSAMLAATQIDLDRLGTLPEAVRRKPFVVLRSLGERWSSLQRLPIPLRLSVGVDAVTLAGASLQRFNADIHGAGGAWTLDSLAFRAPGVTQMRLGGRVDVTPAGAEFAGPVHIEARDPRALAAWLTDRSDTLAASGPFRADGEVRIGPQTLAIDRLKAELDRVSLEGRFAY